MQLQFPDFVEFEAFDQAILREIIRDGETEMSARLATANSADQRALTIVGFQLTIAIASISAAYALLTRKTVDFELGMVASAISIGMLSASYFGLRSATPRLFCFPGNDPKNWEASQWNYVLKNPSDATIQKALVEQCFTLHTGIRDNITTMEQSANALKTSIGVMFAAIYTGTVVTLVVLFGRLAQ